MGLTFEKTAHGFQPSVLRGSTRCISYRLERGAQVVDYVGDGEGRHGFCEAPQGVLALQIPPVG